MANLWPKRLKMEKYHIISVCVFKSMSFPKFLISTLKNSAANQISKKNIENPEFDRQFYKAQFKISITNIKLQFSLIRF